MATNTGLTRELAVKLIRKQEILCPNCGEMPLIPRYGYKNENTEYKCPSCDEIYHPAKLI